MDGVRPNDVDYDKALTPGEFYATSAATQFYAFADQCMQWAKTASSPHERAVYCQMGLHWLGAAARLQTVLRCSNTEVPNLSQVKQTHLERPNT